MDGESDETSYGRRPLGEAETDRFARASVGLCKTNREADDEGERRIGNT